MKLSIAMPLYNEEKTIKEILRRICSVTLPGGLGREIVITDDCSRDASGDKVREFMAENPGVDVKLFRHERNRGKGASVRTCFENVTGDIVLVQDADLEYDPRDYVALLTPILEGNADAVYGSRFLGGPHRVLFYWHSVGNRWLTTMSNMFTNLNLTDMETCYKAFKVEVIRSFEIKSRRFGIEPEITAKVAKRKYRIYEVPISYAGRTYAEGKKINWKDAVSAFFTIIKYRFFE
jgi:glycosyltransferase involved in cell wall biosynthesis